MTKVIGIVPVLALIAACSSSPPKNVLYVTNERAGTLTLIDVDRQQAVGEITLGKRPRGIVLSPDKSRCYVALSGSPIAGPGVDESKLPPPDKGADGIGEVYTSTGKLVRVLRAGSDPEGVALSKDGKEAFIANEDTGQVSIVQIADGTVSESFKVGAEPEGISLTPDGKQAWATSEDAGAVYVIDLASHQVVKSIEVGARPRSIAFLPDGSRAYIPAENEGTLTVIDTGALTATRKINLGDGMRPMGQAMSPDGKQLYVSTGRSKMVLIVDTASDQVVGTIEAGQRPWGIAVSPD